MNQVPLSKAWRVIGQESALGAVLRVVVDETGVGHFAYATARRTICLDRTTDECELAVTDLPATHCLVCEETRRRLQRRRRDWWNERSALAGLSR